MPRPPETPDIRASKTLAYILRHGAEKEGLHIRSDGYIKLDDVLARPKMREVDKAMVLRLVEENAKKRFELVYGYDPSPPPPKKGKGQGKGKNPNQKKQVAATSLNSNSQNGGTGPDSTSSACGSEEKSNTDAAAVDDLQAQLATSKISSTEIPLILLPNPNTESVEVTDPRGGYFIRASQGHSIQLEGVAHLTPVTDDEDGRGKVGLMVHGTKWELWETLKEQGLSRMARQHIHLAPALDLSGHHITPRPSSTLLIYLDLGKMVKAGIPVYVSANGVILTPGDEEGKVGKEYWRLAEKVEGGLKGKRTVVWRDGEDVMLAEQVEQ